MRSDQEFNTYFVSIVQNYEILYNHALKGSRMDHDNIWEMISKMVGGTGNLILILNIFCFYK